MILEQFHFLEPLWLLALLPLIIVFLLAFKTSTDSRAWEKIIDNKLLPLLLQGEDKNTNKFAKFLLAITWIIAVLALADPVWEKIPRPVFQTNTARIIVLDLSNSMLIEDVKPSRIARARFKIEDILSREEEGQTGLVLFAGEAFTAAPLTRDTETIRSMLKVLAPQIMPAQGSRADKGLAKAHELFKQAGIINGQILLIADGVSQKAASLNVAKDLFRDGHTVSVMAIGTAEGGKLNFRNNVTKVVKLDSEPLKKIAQSGGGKFHLLTSNNTDLKHLLTPLSNADSLTNKQNTTNENDEIQNREWHSTGPLLVLLLLPFAALAFRRGWLLNITIACFIISFVAQPKEVIAAEKETQNQWQNLVERLSKNKAQRANNALLNEEYEKARDLSVKPLSLGSAEYKLENYEEALSHFKNAHGVDARYNEGNTLAKLQKYEEAITAYDEALKLDANMQDALDNKKAIEDFLKQLQQSGKKKQSSNENQQGNPDSENNQQEQQSGKPNENQDKQDGSQSANNEQEQQDGEQNQNKDENNQFSDANEELEKNKKEAEEENLQASQNEPEQKDDKENKDADSKKDELVKDKNKAADNSTNETIKTQNSEKQLAEELSQEERMAAEQWLRRIPDDPGGLLRRKFRHQYNQNRRNSRSSEDPW